MRGPKRAAELQQSLEWERLASCFEPRWAATSAALSFCLQEARTARRLRDARSAPCSLRREVVGGRLGQGREDLLRALDTSTGQDDRIGLRLFSGLKGFRNFRTLGSSLSRSW